MAASRTTSTRRMESRIFAGMLRLTQSIALTFDLCEGARETSGYDAPLVAFLRVTRPAGATQAAPNP